jgi:hypothetical protein
MYCKNVDEAMGTVSSKNCHSVVKELSQCRQRIVTVSSKLLSDFRQSNTQNAVNIVAWMSTRILSENRENCQNVANNIVRKLKVIVRMFFVIVRMFFVIVIMFLSHCHNAFKSLSECC